MIKIETIVVSPYSVNCYILYCENTKDGIIVDPGDEANKIIKTVSRLGVNVKGIVLTHCHADHILALDDIKAHYGVRLMIHKDEAPLLANGKMNLTPMFTGKSIEHTADVLLNDGDVIKIGEREMKVIHTPGHTSGCLCLLGDGILVSGDTLFAQSYGRTDFPTGDAPTLAKSLDKLLKLPEETKVYPGHYDSSTIGIEKKYNLMASELMEYYL